MIINESFTSFSIRRSRYITINKFGGATLFDENTGWLYEGTTKEEYIENLKKAILECIANPDEVTRRGKNARKKAKKYTWQEKIGSIRQFILIC